MIKAQEFFNKEYEWRKKSVELINISDEKLEGNLKLENFSKLKKFDCKNNRLTKLEINDCSKITKVYCFANQLTELKLGNSLKITTVDCSDNLLNDLDIRGCPKITKLYFSNNPLNNLHLDNLEVNEWKKIQEQLKDCLRENKKGKQYYDLQVWRNFQGASTTSPASSIRTFSSSSRNSLASLLPKTLPFFPQTSNLKHEKATNEVVEVNQGFKVHELQSQLMKLNDIVCPESDFDFTRLENEIKKLKSREVELKRQSKKNELNHLKSNFTEKEQEWFETYCEAEEELQQNNSYFVRKQLEKLENKLLKKLTKEELLNLVQLKRESVDLEKQLINLDFQEEQSKIEIFPKK